MAYALDVKCTVCTYDDGILIGIGGYVALCSTCKSIVNLERKPNTYIAKPCPTCSQTIPRSHFVDQLLLKRVPCPQCMQGILTFEEVLHMLMRDDPQIPQVGQRIHAQLDKQGKLHIPDVWRKRIHLEPTPHQILMEEPFEAVVTHIEATTIMVRLIRQLSWSEI